jgi:hypothetical protein
MRKARDETTGASSEIPSGETMQADSCFTKQSQEVAFGHCHRALGILLPFSVRKHPSEDRRRKSSMRGCVTDECFRGFRFRNRKRNQTGKEKAQETNEHLLVKSTGL